MSIGDAASRSGVPPKTIRYCEEIGLIAPAVRLENRYRAYSEADVQTLRFVQRARSLGFPLKEVGELLTLHRDRRRRAKDVKRLALAPAASAQSARSSRNSKLRTTDGGNMTATLVEKTCTPCRGGIPPLTCEEADAFLAQAP